MTGKDYTAKDMVALTDCQQQTAQFQRRLQSIASDQQQIFLAMYANPVLNKQREVPQAIPSEQEAPLSSANAVN
ncbi:MAG: hypothetical protein LRY40_04305 [Shewanella fodinae]|nr:hypothetical protein [Shewanella fodinae]